MCGIAALISCGDPDSLSRMTEAIAHRGPDDHGTWGRLTRRAGYVGLGNRRLSIIDLSAAGHMPMENDDGTIWITYNGEIYNFGELRNQLIARGCRLRSSTDTEVVLRMYEEKGN